jgi:Ca2+-binding RTX toxin-like protein
LLLVAIYRLFSAVIVEELGHAIDSRINKAETPGDEGAIFRLLVGGAKIAQNLLAKLRTEDDWGTILVDGQQLIVEMAVINGDDLANSLEGTDENDTLNGLGGDDTLSGFVGIDVLNGGTGNDNLFNYTNTGTSNGDDGNDYIVAAPGSTINGGTGIDRLSIDYFNQLTAVNLIVDAQGNISDNQGSTITGIEELSASGTLGNDYMDLSFSTYSVALSGGEGKDTLITGTGDDFISAAVGSVINTGAGKDSLTLFNKSTSDFILTFTSNEVATGNDGTSLKGIESFTIERDFGTTVNNNYIDATVRTDSNYLNGGRGNNTLIGGAGADILYGGDATNRLVGGAGNDILNGGYFENSINTLLGGGGDDTLVGGIGNSTLDGGDGNDYLDSSATIGTVNGGAGDDRIIASIGSKIDGGDGIDALILQSRSNTNYRLVFTADGAAQGNDGTSLADVESWRFTADSGNNYIDASARTTGSDIAYLGQSTGPGFVPGTGNNTFIGGAGNDSLAGGYGTNTLVGGAGDDYYSIATSGNSNVINDVSGNNDSLKINLGYDYNVYGYRNFNFISAFFKSGTTLLIDTSGDGKIDSQDTSILNFFNQSGGKGTGFIETINDLPGSYIFKLIKTDGDFGQDRRADILWRQGNGAVTMWQMDGSNVVSNSTVSAPIDASWKIIDNSDYNGDGAADILWSNPNGAVLLWQMNGSTITTAGLVSAGADLGWKVATAGDFNGDNKTDILWRNVNGDVAIMQMDGQTILSSTVLGKVDSSWKTVRTGDSNGDAKADILWQNDNGDIALWSMNGIVVNSAGVVFKPGAAWKIAGVNDFDGFGQSNVLLQNDDGRIAIWRYSEYADPSSSNVDNIIGNVPAGFNIVDTGDYNGDKSADILLRNDQGLNAIWFTNGRQVISQSFIASTDPSWTASPMGIDALTPPVLLT